MLSNVLSEAVEEKELSLGEHEDAPLRHMIQYAALSFAPAPAETGTHHAVDTDSTWHDSHGWFAESKIPPSLHRLK